MSFNVFRKFAFDAIHSLGKNVHVGHRYGNIHGHSFLILIYISGKSDSQKV